MCHNVYTISLDHITNLLGLLGLVSSPTWRPIMSRAISSRCQRYLGPVPRAQSQRQRLLPGARIAAFQGAELLRHAYEHVAYLGQCISLANADARAAVKGQILPPGAQLPVGPALWPEFVRIGSIEVGAPVHRVHVIGDKCTLGDEDGREAVAAASDGEHGVTECLAFVPGDDRMQTQS